MTDPFTSDRHRRRDAATLTIPRQEARAERIAEAQADGDRYRAISAAYALAGFGLPEKIAVVNIPDEKRRPTVVPDCPPTATTLAACQNQAVPCRSTPPLSGQP